MDMDSKVLIEVAHVTSKSAKQFSARDGVSLSKEQIERLKNSIKNVVRKHRVYAAAFVEPDLEVKPQCFFVKPKAP